MPSASATRTYKSISIAKPSEQPKPFEKEESWLAQKPFMTLSKTLRRT